MFDISKGLLRGAGATGVAIAMAAAAAIPASASISASVSLSFRASQCSGAIVVGSFPRPRMHLPRGPRGSVKLCALQVPHGRQRPLLRLLHWSTRRPTTAARPGPPPWRRRPSSSSTRTDPRPSSAPPSPTRATARAAHPFRVGVRLKPSSASVTPTVCSGYTVSRYYNSTCRGRPICRQGRQYMHHTINLLPEECYKARLRSSPSTSTGRPTSTPGAANLYWKETAGCRQEWTAILLPTGRRGGAWLCRLASPLLWTEHVALDVLHHDARLVEAVRAAGAARAWRRAAEPNRCRRLEGSLLSDSALGQV